MRWATTPTIYPDQLPVARRVGKAEAKEMRETRFRCAGIVYTFGNSEGQLTQRAGGARAGRLDWIWSVCRAINKEGEKKTIFCFSQLLHFIRHQMADIASSSAPPLGVFNRFQSRRYKNGLPPPSSSFRARCVNRKEEKGERDTRDTDESSSIDQLPRSLNVSLSDK